MKATTLGLGLGLGRRVGAIMALRLARLVLRGSVALYQCRAIPRSALRVGLAVTKALEQAGALLVLGRRKQAQPLSNKEDSNDRVD